MIRNKMENQHFFYHNRNHFSNMNEMRLSRKLCDVIIEIKDRKVYAHKVVLATNLKYFETMFLNAFRESEQDVITMENVDGSVLELFISYAYTGEIILTSNNALDLLEVANYLNEEGIKQGCINFLEKHLRQEEACRAYKFANAIECFSLKYIAKSLILSNFENCSQTTGYLDLDVYSLKEILSSASLVGSEQTRFQSIVRWIVDDVEKRRGHINDLLDFIEITTLPADWLLKYLCKNTENENYTGVIEDIMIIYNNKIEGMKNQCRRLREYLIVIGVVKNQYNHCKIQSYDFSEKKWSKPLELAVSNTNVASVHSTVLKDKLYSFIRTEMRNEWHLRVFDPKTKQCEVLTYDCRLLRGAAMCACIKYLYFCGGQLTDSPETISDQVLKYDPLTNSFETLPPMRTKRIFAAATFRHGYLYVLGGYDGSEFLCSVEKYDVQMKTWTILPSMCEGRFVHTAAVINEKVYAFGDVAIRMLEVCEPLEKSWKLIADMNRNKYNALVVAHEGKLIAIKGKYDNSIVVYDPREERLEKDFVMASNLEIEFPSGGIISSMYDINED